MTRKITAVCVLSFALAIGASAQTATTSTNPDAHYSQAQLKKMAQDAHTPAQYGVLAAYYGKQQKEFQAQAETEKQEWARRSANIMLTAAKYPRPVDSAHYLYEYYAYKAAEAGQMATRFGQLASPDAGVRVR
jgi:hypothetical protein